MPSLMSSFVQSGMSQIVALIKQKIAACFTVALILASNRLYSI